MNGQEIPRRVRLDLNTGAELAIRQAIAAVEHMPADVRLTDAVVLLGEALASVADFVDGVSPVTRRRVDATARCVVGEYCSAHGYVHGAEAEELRDKLSTLQIAEVDRVLDEVDARDSDAYLARQQAKR